MCRVHVFKRIEGGTIPYKELKKIRNEERFAQLIHNPAISMCRELNAVDRIDRSLTVVAKPNCCNAQTALFDMMCVHVLCSAWCVREEIDCSSKRFICS